MRRLLRLTTLGCVALTLAVGASGAPSALAAGGNPVINDCQAHGVLTSSYTVAALHHALAVMPEYTKQYTSCYDIINLAIAHARNGRSGTPGSSSGGSFLPTPVLVILVLLILAAITFAALAVRARRSPPGGGTPAA
ncbi:MAG: hypothetical protein WBQ18_14395 [Solirubrobacteraceae bacterium]